MQCLDPDTDDMGIGNEEFQSAADAFSERFMVDIGIDYQLKHITEFIPQSQQQPPSQPDYDYLPASVTDGKFVTILEQQLLHKDPMLPSVQHQPHLLQDFMSSAKNTDGAQDDHPR